VYMLMLNVLYLQQFWRLGSNGMGSKATEINTFWYKLPVESVDALYERQDGRIVFFKGKSTDIYYSNAFITWA